MLSLGVMFALAGCRACRLGANLLACACTRRWAHLLSSHGCSSMDEGDKDCAKAHLVWERAKEAQPLALQALKRLSSRHARHA